MRVFVAEKPQLAQVVVSGMDNSAFSNKRKGYIEVGPDIVTWCIGHLLENMMPEEIDPAMTLRWDNLPYPTPMQLKPQTTTADQCEIVLSLIKKADELVNVGDPDEEGQLLIDELFLFAGIDPDADNVKRMLISDMNPGAAKKALNALRPNREFRGMRMRAMARSHADYLMGINLSSGLKLKAREQGYMGSVSVGRVQTPVLGLTVRRFRDNQSFDSIPFYRVVATLSHEGQTFEFDVPAPENTRIDDNGRLLDEQDAQQFCASLQGTPATVSLVEHKPGTTPPPLPFSLLKLSSRVGKRFGLSPAQTLQITQDLREKYHCITYNRSDCQYLSNEQWDAAPETLASLLAAPLEASIKSVLSIADTTVKSRAFNDSKITAHTAIIPVPANTAGLNEQERQVFSEISRNWLAQFLPDKAILRHKVELTIGGHTARHSSTECTSPGWQVLFSGETNEEEENNENSAGSALNSLAVGQTLPVTWSVKTGETKPPALFTLSTLMDELPRISRHIRDDALRATMIERDKGRSEDGRGIGTPATRAAIFDTLEHKRGFFKQNEKKQIVPTEAGMQLYDSLPPVYTWPDLTAIWEVWLSQIEEEKITLEHFIDTQVKPFVAGEIERLKSGKTTLKLAGATYTCPECKSRRLQRLKDKKDDKKTYWLCSGAFETDRPCQASFDDRAGKPVARKKSPKTTTTVKK